MNTIIYCYDAYCGWCYGFCPVIKRISEEYIDRIHFEVLSGGMIINDKPLPLRVTAGYIQNAYKRVEELTRIKFGKDWLWHIFHPDESDWFPNSEKPAIAMCIFKEYHPELQVEFASDIQNALHVDGRDLCDDEAYRHLLEKYAIPSRDFYKKLHAEEYKDKAYYEFALVKQLKVSGFPTVMFQETESRFYLLARGYSDHGTLRARIESVLEEVGNKPSSQINPD